MHISSIQTKSDNSTKSRQPKQGLNSMAKTKELKADTINFKGGVGRDVGRAVGAAAGGAACIAIALTGGLALIPLVVGAGVNVIATVAGAGVGDTVGDAITKNLKKIKK